MLAKLAATNVNFSGMLDKILGLMLATTTLPYIDNANDMFIQNFNYLTNNFEIFQVDEVDENLINS